MIGSGTFIPGFEEQLIGIKAGETRTVKVDVPGRTIRRPTLAGKDAEFEVTAKSVEAPGAVTIDDEFAKQLGLESLAKLRDAVQGAHRARARRRAARKLKRQLLDALDERHKFELPPTLVEQEFDNVWKTVENDLKQQGRTFADEGTTEEEAQGRIPQDRRAARAARPGASPRSASKNSIKVTDDEVTRAVVERARQFPGQEQQVWEFYRNNPQALAEPARADLRGEGGRLPGRARQGDREEGLARGALQGRRGRAGRRTAATPARDGRCIGLRDAAGGKSLARSAGNAASGAWSRDPQRGLRLGGRANL